MRSCVFQREEEGDEGDDKTVNSDRMAGAGRRTRTKTASRRVLGSLSVQEYSPFLFSRSFFLLLRLPRAHVDLFFASCLAPEVSIRSLRRREEKEEEAEEEEEEDDGKQKNTVDVHSGGCGNIWSCPLSKSKLASKYESPLLFFFFLESSVRVCLSRWIERPSEREALLLCFVPPPRCCFVFTAFFLSRWIVLFLLSSSLSC